MTKEWSREVKGMADRIINVRELLVKNLKELGAWWIPRSLFLMWKDPRVTGATSQSRLACSATRVSPVSRSISCAISGTYT